MRKKRGTLANLLLKNYLFLYFLTTAIFIFSVIFTVSVGRFSLKNLSDSPVTADQIMKDNYTNIDITKVSQYNGFVEIIDNKYNVVYRKGFFKKDRPSKYTSQQYHDLLINNLKSSDYDDNYYYSFSYNKNKDFLLVLGIPKTPPNGNYDEFYSKLAILFFIGVIFYFFTLIIGTIIFSRLTSKNFVTPLKIILKGVDNIAQGDYSTRIHLKCRNEFSNLKDAVNIMASKIEEETNLKEKAEETRRRLIMDISHDLKTPLASVIGYSDFLVNNPSLSLQERSKYLQIIQRNSIRANDLITDLFEFSKFESYTFKLHLKSENICEFMREIIASYIPEIEEKNFNYNFDISEKDIFIAFDWKSMDRAISNLITNGLKYNPPKTTLNISLKQRFGKAEIIIQDDGVGIPKDIAKDIFKPFVRVDSSRNSQSGGTGLGLAITKKIIEKHDGTITLETDKNKGCKFTITL
ncbi:ATP-binding protein [Haloimpatiens sp. FM7330]|uniref:sensor histidine kinase n=1 Tax=Haloimpatiens sp. FM7330 TaxID=3298610 RepID=UPI00362542F5